MESDGTQTLSTDEMNTLVQALGRFGMGMLTTFITHQDNIPLEAQNEFCSVIADWTSIASEFIDMDSAIREALGA
jgi:hypothetical protein